MTLGIHAPCVQKDFSYKVKLIVCPAVFVRAIYCLDLLKLVTRAKCVSEGQQKSLADARDLITFLSAHSNFELYCCLRSVFVLSDPTFGIFFRRNLCSIAQGCTERLSSEGQAYSTPSQCRFDD